MAEQPQTLPLPTGLSPDQLDVTTELSSLLSRLRAPTNLPGIASSTAGQTPAAPTPSQNTQSQSQTSTGDISLKDFPASTDHLRQKLQEAKAAILALPDMDKDIAEQEAEIKELESRIRKQKVQLATLREKGDRFAATDRMQE